MNDNTAEVPGLASEESVVRKSRQNSSARVRMNLEGLEEGCLTSASGEVQEKRTRFSLVLFRCVTNTRNHKNVILWVNTDI